HFGHDKILLPDADAPSVYPLHRGTDFEEAVARSRHGTLDEQHVAFRIDLHDLQVLDGHRFVPHPAVHLLALRYAVRVAHHREGTVSAVVLGTVGHRSAGVAPPLDGAGGAFPLGNPRYVDVFAFREDVHLHFLADFVVRRVDAAN